MKYRIMLVKSPRDNHESLYQYLTTSIDGIIQPMEFKSKEDLDQYVDKMLNEDGYAKSDFVIIEVVDYNIGTDLVPVV